MNFKTLSALAGLLCATPAFSLPVLLDFEGATSFASIGELYNGGTDSAGASGPNMGASFGGDALAVSNDATTTFFSNAPSPGAVLAPVGVDAALNVAAGFYGQASFFYSSLANVTVDIFSGLNGTGTLLGSFSLLANAQNGCSDSSFCRWDLASVNFSGFARSIQFAGAANAAGFDDVRITVPEPAALLLLALGLGGLLLTRRLQSKA